MGVNSLPTTVTRQRRDCALNRGPSAPESSTQTTRLSSHPLDPMHMVFSVSHRWLGRHVTVDARAACWLGLWGSSVYVTNDRRACPNDWFGQV